MRYQTNDELAADWYRLANSVNTNIANKHLRGKIASSDVDIPGYYRQHGNLDELRVKGIGVGMKYQMQLLFEKGLDEARQELSEQTNEQMKESVKWKEGRRKAGRRGDIDPSCEGSYKRYEG